MGVCYSESEIRLTEGIGHAEGVAVCFHKVAAFDVGLEVEVGDEGAGLGGFAVEGGFAGWVGWGEGWEGGVDCGCHCGRLVCLRGVCCVLQEQSERLKVRA